MSVIEYFYSAHSVFAYLGSKRLMEITSAVGWRIDHRPYNLDNGVSAAGSIPFKERSRGHRQYFFKREIARWSEYRNAPVMNGRPTHHDNDMALGNGMLIAGLQRGIRIDQLAHTMLEAHWRDDVDLADRAILADLARGIGIEPEPLLDIALTPEVQKTYKANTEAAIARSVFGSPTYFVDGDMFYGQDRLEMVERALRQPFKGDWPLII